MYAARVIIIFQMGLIVSSVHGFDAPPSIDPDITVVDPASGAMLPETNERKVKLYGLRVDLIQVSDENYRLDVDYTVRVEKWIAGQEFNLNIQLVSKRTKDQKLAWCVPLDFPTKQGRHYAKWDSTFRVRIAISAFPGKPKDFELYATVTENGHKETLATDNDRRLYYKSLDDDRKPEALVDPKDRRGLLVILPGITGSDKAQRDIRDRIASSSPELPDTGLAAQIWDWTELAEIDSLPLRDRARVSRETEAAAELFANEVQEWREGNQNKSLYLLCGSGGASIALLAAKSLQDEPDKPVFKNVVFASAAVSTQRPLKPLTDISGHLYNYYSYNDYILVGIIRSFFGTFKFELAWPAAGRFGYRDADNLSEKLMQLGWESTDSDKLKNRGRHLECYEEDYFEKFFLPLFCDKLTIPKRWKPKILPSYRNLETCEPRKCEY